MAIIVFTYETSINREGPKFGRKFCYETDLAALHTPYDRLCTENTAIYRLKYLTKRNITQVINVVLSESVYNVSNTRTDRLVLWLDATVDSVLRRDILEGTFVLVEMLGGNCPAIPIYHAELHAVCYLTSTFHRFLSLL